jgi:hypothetical protein
MTILRSFIILGFFVYSNNLLSQNNDAEMEKILQERRSYNQAYSDFEGFRIQFFNGLSEGQARNAQAKFTNLFPEIPAYLSYNQPEWKVQAGDFKEKLEAHSVLSRIREEFPGALILKTKIKI